MSERTSVRRVTYKYNIEYEILSSPNLLDPHNMALLSVGKLEHARRFVVVDSNVQRYYGPSIRSYFSQNQIETRIIPFTSGEEYKTVERYLYLARELDAFPICRRDEPIIAIGGGVLTDVVGFVASCYRRGVPHIKVPTTLMGYVDASIGVKAGINFNGNKNRLGGFVPPVKVLLDRSFLKTLPKRHILNGVCEIIKLAIIKDAGLFSLLEASGAPSVEAKFQDEAGAVILDRSISGMLDELQPNLLEEELARKIDFGHTFSYGLETRYGASLFHGEAVLLDVALSTLIAGERRLLSATDVERIFHLMASLGLVPDPSNLDANILWQSLQERVYHRNGLQRVPLPSGIGGCVFVNDVSLDEIQLAVKAMEDRLVIKNGLAWQR
jgi:3-dehydroquinate synthetase